MREASILILGPDVSLNKTNVIIIQDITLDKIP